jgi:hypothetical protein
MLTMIEGVLCDDSGGAVGNLRRRGQSTIGATGSGCLRRQCFWYTKAELSGYVG